MSMKAQLMSDIFSKDRERAAWPVVKLGDICKIKSGGTPSTKNRDYYEGDIPFLSINDMTSQGKYVTSTEKHITDEAVNSCSTWIAPAGTLVYSMCASVGFVSIVNVDFTMNQAIAAITHINKDVDKEYLYYQLLNYKDKPEFERVVTTGAQRNINATILKNFDIVLPPLEEQKRIAKILSDYDNLIKANDEKSEVLRKQKAQLMNNIFAERESLQWRTVKLGDIASINSGKGIKKSEYLEDGIYPIIGSNGEIGRCDKLNNTKQVLTTGRVGTIGTIQKVTNAWITDNTLIIDILNNDIDYNFMYYMLHTVDFEKITTGNAQPLVTAGRLKEVEISIPCISEQHRIAQVLSDYDNLITTNVEELDILKKTKLQLMTDIFSAEI